jgi:hypothetical protein
MLAAEMAKTIKLAEDIKENGLSPADRLMVIPTDDPLRFVVAEGNRRLTALRILSEPTIAESSLKKPTYKKLQHWSSEYLKNPIKEIDCVVFESRAGAVPWVRRRHIGESAGAGVVGWGPIEQRRFEERQSGIKTLDMQAFDLVAAKGTLDETTRDKLHDFPITNLERLLEDEAVRKRIGLQLNTQRQLTSFLPDEEIVKPLTRMVRDIANKTIRVDHIYDATKRSTYLDGFTNKDLPNHSKAGSKARVIVITPTAAPTTSVTAAGSRNRRPSKPRRSVVHPRCKLNITKPRVERIFKEMREIPVDDFPNTVGILLRVFLELTVDTYFTTHKLAAFPKGKDTLAARLSAVSASLIARGVMTAKELKGVDYAARERKVVGANIYTFHAFVHNPDFAPQSVDLRTYWDNLQLFFERVWP